MKQYTPRGKVTLLLQAMAEDPGRIWSIPEAAEIMECGRTGVLAMVKTALLDGAMYRGKRGGYAVLSPRPFRPTGMGQAERRPITPQAIPKWNPQEDARIPRVIPGWAPPRMVCVRTGS